MTSLCFKGESWLLSVRWSSLDDPVGVENVEKVEELREVGDGVEEAKQESTR